MSDQTISKDKEAKRQEHEANMFALALLMPEKEFKAEIYREPIDLSDSKDKRLKQIARMFGVTVSAVTARMTMLNIIKF